MYKIISTQSSFEAEVVVSDERRLLTSLPSHFNSYFPSPGVSRLFEEYCNECGEYNLKSSVETYNESPCFDNFCKLLNVLADFLYDQDQRPWIAGYENYYFYNLEDRISDSIQNLMIELNEHLQNYSRNDFSKYSDFLTRISERFDLVSLKLESKERNDIEYERFSSFSILKVCFQIKIQELNTSLVDDVDVYTEPETKHMSSTTASTGVRRTDHVVVTVVAEPKEKEEVVVDKELAVRQVKNRILKSILFFDEEDLRKPQSTRENSLFTFMHWVRSMLTKSMLWKNGLDVATFVDGLRIMAEHEQFYEGNFTRTMSAIHLSEHGSESFDTGDLKAKLDQFDAENQRIYAQKITLAQLWDEDGVEFMRGKWTWLSSVMRSWFDNSGALPSYKDFLSASDIEALNSGKKLSLHQL